MAIYPALSLAQTAAPLPAAQAVALEPIDVYIHNAWDTPSRSMSD
ncbi:MAG TPA: hypothetical protein VK729_09915 [Silvibacterium sp.]|nr:hypothetical protein [Silvibacterium sp.]